eukprot:5677725-Amphidinium_carterae.1
MLAKVNLLRLRSKDSSCRPWKPSSPAQLRLPSAVLNLWAHGKKRMATQTRSDKAVTTRELKPPSSDQLLVNSVYCSSRALMCGTGPCEYLCHTLVHWLAHESPTL